LQLRPGAKVSERSPDGRRERGGPNGARPDRKRPDGARRGNRDEAGGAGSGGGNRGRRARNAGGA